MTANLGVLNGLPGTRGTANLGLLNGLAVTNVPTPIDLPSAIDSTGLVTVTGDTTAHVKGGWSQLLVTTADANLVFLQFTSSVGNQDTSMLLDLGIGPATAEQPAIENILCGYALSAGASFKTPNTFLFPLRTTTGTRIAARLQSGTVTAGPTARAASVRIGTMRLSGASAVPSRLDTLGANTASTTGTTIQTTYTQITASTPRDYQALVVMLGSTGASFQSFTPTLTVAQGSAGSETALFTIETETSTNEWIRQGSIAQPFHLFTGHVPAGTRISARLSGSTNASAAILYGVPYA